MNAIGLHQRGESETSILLMSRTKYSGLEMMGDSCVCVIFNI